MERKQKMKIKSKNNEIWLITSVLSLMLALSGCDRKDEEKYGQEILNHTLTKIDVILKTPADLEGKTVTVQGKIINECPSGCWFEVKENGGIIYVDLNPSGFAIPQKIGKEVTVEGKVSLRDNQPIITGMGVEVK
jgi:hypothetical protein